MNHRLPSHLPPFKWGWYFLGLGEYRPVNDPLKRYELFSYESLPPLPQERFDGTFHWLEASELTEREKDALEKAMLELETDEERVNIWLEAPVPVEPDWDALHQEREKDALEKVMSELETDKERAKFLEEGEAERQHQASLESHVYESEQESEAYFEDERYNQTREEYYEYWHECSQEDEQYGEDEEDTVLEYWPLLVSEAQKRGLVLPGAFTTFMQRVHLRRLFSSSTGYAVSLFSWIDDCPDSEPGYLVHFLSDQQGRVRWYLYLNVHGEHCIIAVPDGSPATSALNPLNENMVICATSFEEFLYRFWLENILWYDLSRQQGPLDLLSEEQRRYLLHYHL